MNQPVASFSALRALLLAFAFASCDSAQATPRSHQGAQVFDIPVGDARPMLKRFAIQSNTEILFDVANVSGVKTQEIRGAFTPHEALELMLANTGLVAGRDAKTGAFAVRTATPQELFEAARRRQADLNPYGNGTRIEDGVVKLARYEIVELRLRPFTDDNTDIPRTIDDAKPYVLFNAEAIERSGAISVEDFINRQLTMTSNFGSASGRAPAVSGPYSLTTGAVSLRGLSDTATLILLNGRRLPTTANGVSHSSPDLNAIPLGMIERIEVLPSSASGIYGGSAVGGVINIVTKRRYHGGEIKITYDNSFDTDSAKRRADVTYGFDLEDGRTQVVLFASYTDGNGMNVGDRFDLIRRNVERAQANNPDFFANGAVLVGATPRIESSSGSALQLKPEFGGQTLASSFVFLPPGYRGPQADGGGVLVQRAGELVNQEWPDAPDHPNGLRNGLFNVGKSYSFRAEVRRQMTKRVEAFLDYMYESNSAAALGPALTTVFGIPATAPDNPFTETVNVRASTNSTMETRTNHDRHRVVGGFTARLAHDWVVQADFAWNRGSNETFAANINGAGMRRDATSGELNLFVDTLDAGANIVPYLGGTEIIVPNLFVHEWGARAAGPLPALFGIQPSLAVGLQDRKEGRGRFLIEGTAYPNQPQDNGIPSSPTLSPPQKQKVANAYAELTVPFYTRDNARPFLRLLELQLTGRVDDYEVNITKSPRGASGTSFDPRDPPPLTTVNREYRSTNATIGLRWKPHDDFMLRASYATGFQPPSFIDLTPGNPRSHTVTVVDPRRGNTLTVVQESGLLGNSSLQPETAVNWTAGIVLTPSSFPGLRISLDYVRTEKRNDITQFTQQSIVDNEASFPDRVTRAPVAPGDAFGVGSITHVDWSRLNLFRTELEAYDIAVNYRRPTATRGTFDLSAAASIQPHFRRQISLAAPILEYADTPSAGGPLHVRANAALTWRKGPWQLGWTTTYFDDYKQRAPPFTTSLDPVRNQGGPIVPHQIFHDVFARYKFSAGSGPKWLEPLFANTELLVGIRNVFDEEPAFDGDSIDRFFFSPLGDLRLRCYSISVKRSF